VIDDKVIDMLRRMSQTETVVTYCHFKATANNPRTENWQFEFRSTESGISEGQRLDVELALDILAGNEAAVAGYVDRYLEFERESPRLTVKDIEAVGFKLNNVGNLPTPRFCREFGRCNIELYYDRDQHRWGCCVGFAVFAPLVTLADLRRLLRVFGLDGKKG
jgi:hypothetical protein